MGVLRANKGGFCITFEKNWIQTCCTYAFVYSKSSLLPAKGFSYIESIKKNIVTDRNTNIVLYYQMDVCIKSIGISF